MGLSQAFDDINEYMMVEYMRQWQGLCWQLAHERGFHDPLERPLEGTVRDASPGERMMLIVSEVSEMLESYRRSKDPSQFYIEVDGKPEGTATELADVVIRCLDYAAIYDIDLGNIMMHKLRYNTTRPYRHGGKEI